MNVSGVMSSSQKDRLRILVVDALTHFGGAHRVMTAVLPRLQADFDIAVIDTYGNATYRNLLMAQGVDVSNLGLTVDRPYIGGKGTWKRPFLMLASVPRLLHLRQRLARYIREWNPDVVYTNQESMLSLLSTLSEVRRRCLVWHCHGLGHSGQINFITRAMLKRRGTAVIAVSQATGNQFRRKVSANRVHICHNGVDVAEVEKSSAAGPLKPLPVRRADEVVFLIAATLQRNKGQHLAIQALASAVGQGVDASLWLAGDLCPGGDSGFVEELKAMVDRFSLTARVHFLGWRDDIWAVMHGADVVMLCSLDYESFGLGLAEAMVLGKACIGPRVGGVPEVIEDGVTGLICEPGSVDQMAGAMVRMAKGAALRKSCGMAGKSRVNRLFGIGGQVEGIGRILKMLHASAILQARKDEGNAVSS